MFKSSPRKIFDKYDKTAFKDDNPGTSELNLFTGIRLLKRETVHT